MNIRKKNAFFIFCVSSISKCNFTGSDYHTDTSQAMIQLAMVKLMLNRIKK